MSRLLSKSAVRESLIVGLTLPFSISDSDSDDSDGSGDSVSASISSSEWTLIVAIYGAGVLIDRLPLSIPTVVSTGRHAFPEGVCGSSL